MDLQQTSQMPESEYRQYLPDLSSPRFTTMARQDPYEYVHDFKSSGNPPWLHALYMHWLDLLKEPYRGVTSDGRIIPDLYPIQDEELPIEEIVKAAQKVISQMDDKQKAKSLYHIDAPEWRTWSNPEFLLSDKGIRLDEVSEELKTSTMALLKATLSSEGYEKAISAMRINGFLGELVKGSRVMNEFSYNICFFGAPSVSAPWGLSFYGHHLCLNIFFYRRQLLIAPWFTGAEPNIIDAGPYSGTRILHEEEALGLQLMQSLTPAQQATVQTYAQMHDPAMPHGRWNHDDQRHLCGAYRDNRTVPYEGISVSSLTTNQQSLALRIFEQYLLYLPQASRSRYLSLISSHLSDTYFSWIGGYADTDPFYFRLQSPVIIVEFDHHSGVFLNNKEPAKFHIHTLMRMPNAGDYGVAIRNAIPAAQMTKQEWCWDGER